VEDTSTARPGCRVSVNLSVKGGQFEPAQASSCPARAGS
jgi:hypothetical protein